MDGRDVNPIPARPDEAQVPKVGVDSWVATHEGRVHRHPVLAAFDRVPRPAFYLGFAIGYLSSTFQAAIVFAILIVVLIVRPSGLLGRAAVQKV